MNYKIINLDIKKTSNKKGWLLPFHFLGSKNKDNQLPIKVKRIFVIGGIKKGDVRGEHALLRTNQIIFVINGSAKIFLDDGYKKKTILLSIPTEGILIEPLIWRTIKILKDNTLIIVFCDREHNEKEYIRNYENFIQQIRKRLFKK